MSDLKLFMLLLGSKPKGRNTEQHDVFFGIGSGLYDLLPSMKSFWPEAQGKLHIDAWREVTAVDGHQVRIIPRTEQLSTEKSVQLFFLNLGGYKENEFEEFHYKMLVVAPSLDKAKTVSRQTAFFKHNGLKESPIHRMAEAHIDDKYGVDVDDIHNVEDILPSSMKYKYSIQITPSDSDHRDDMYLGYLKLADIVSGE